MTIQIQPASPSHIPIIRDIAARTWPTAFAGILSSEQITYMLEWMYSISSLTEQMVMKSHVFLIAQRKELPVGYLSYEIDGGGAGVTRLHKLYTLPEVHGSGVGSALLYSVINAAKLQGQSHVELNVNRYNSAINFYERHGFIKIDHQDIDIGGGFYMNDVVMQLTLDTISF